MITAQEAQVIGIEAYQARHWRQCTRPTGGEDRSRWTCEADLPRHAAIAAIFVPDRRSPSMTAGGKRLGRRNRAQTCPYSTSAAYGHCRDAGSHESLETVAKAAPRQRSPDVVGWRRGARGRSRTDTLFRAADFRATSAFAAPPHRASRVRGLEHAFTVAMQAVGARRLLSTPSLRA